MDTVPLIAGAIPALGAAVFLADRVLLAMEAKGWIYWRKTKGLSSIGADRTREVDPAARAAERAMEQERPQERQAGRGSPASRWTWRRGPYVFAQLRSVLRISRT